MKHISDNDHLINDVSLRLFYILSKALSKVDIGHTMWVKTLGDAENILFCHPKTNWFKGQLCSVLHYIFLLVKILK